MLGWIWMDVLDADFMVLECHLYFIYVLNFSWVYKNICTLALVFCILHLWDDVGFALNGVVFEIDILLLEM